MEKANNITELKFESGYLVLSVNNQILKLRLTDISEKLANASERELNNFKISPSGYGINWISLNEDLSINGLLKLDKSKDSLSISI